ISSSASTISSSAGHSSWLKKSKPMTDTGGADRKRVLIIKPGYSETLDADASGIVSLGDILRTTVVLHLFPPERYHVTWLVDPKGVPLLHGNPFIHRLL